jgi:DNA-binding NarL/FixJ family response regulator
MIRSTPADVVVLDVQLPGGGAPAVLAQLGDVVPPTLAVSASDERDHVIATVRAGASGYVLKTATSADIVDAVRRTAGGEAVFSPQLAGHLLDLDIDRPQVADAEWEALTDRQREVLRLLARGLTYAEIAEELVVAVKTVETHVRHVLQTLQVSNRHQASRWAYDRGIT